MGPHRPSPLLCKRMCMVLYSSPGYKPIDPRAKCPSCGHVRLYEVGTRVKVPTLMLAGSAALLSTDLDETTIIAAGRRPSLTRLAMWELGVLIALVWVFLFLSRFRFSLELAPQVRLNLRRLALEESRRFSHRSDSLISFSSPVQVGGPPISTQQQQ
jgi:hypothetical protein